MDNTTQQITQQIHHVCQQQQLTCLHAIESGSRAWGFASPDSDYDVRMIYAQPLDWYLQLFEAKDTFEYIQNDLFDVPFDIAGWDIRKVLRLMYKSNASVFEWLNSPIVYHSSPQVVSLLSSLQPHFFLPKTVYYHYQGMAKNASDSLQLDHPVKLKKWFYLLRALLCSLWTATERTPPPVHISGLLPLLSHAQQASVSALISLKQHSDESYQHLLSAELQSLTHSLWRQCEQLNVSAGNTFGKKGDIEALNTFFCQLLTEPASHLENSLERGENHEPHH